MVEERKLVEGSVSQNTDFQSATALQIRLDTTKILQDIEFFLRGKEENWYLDETTGEMKPRIVQSGEPKANARGIQAILNYCRTIFNTQVVQGNYTIERYLDFIVEKRKELAERLIVNTYEWDLPSDDVVNELCDEVMNLAEPFLSRMIDNKERDSYSQTIRHSESNTISGKGNFNLFGGGQ